VALAITAVVLGALVTVAMTVSVGLRNTRRSRDESITFDGEIGALSCHLDAGNVTITAGEHSGAVVHRSLRHGWRKPATTEQLTDGKLVITAHRPRGFLAGWWWVNYDITLPAPTPVEVRTTAGRVTVAGTSAAVDVRTQAGKVHVRDTSGALRLHATAGAVEGDRLRSPSVDVHTQAGHVLLNFDAAPETVGVVAAAGAVEIRLPGGPFRVDVASSAGGTRVEVPTAPDASRIVSVHTRAGSVKVVPRSADPTRLAVTRERLDDPAGAALVAALLADLFDRYGEEDPDAPAPAELAPPEGVFLVVRLDGRPVGCGGLRRVATGEGEVKRMYVVPDSRRLGVGARILAAIEAEARQQRYGTLRLETGLRQPEAIALYERFGYVRVANFPPYEHVPMSVCYAKELPDT